MSQDASTPHLHQWLTAPLSADVSQSIERLSRERDVQHLAVMPDVHLAHQVCVGVALATTRLLYPAAVGSDIGCGMAAIQFEAEASLLGHEQAAAQLLAGMYRLIPTLKQPRVSVPAELPAGLQDRPLTAPRLEKLKSRDGRFQFGTLGRGNHFVELQADEENRLWLMVHSGSRGMGQAITSHHVGGTNSHGPGRNLISLDADSPSGQAYLADLAWAIEYAEQNRLAIIARVAHLFEELFSVRLNTVSLIHSHHNHVRQETHFGERYWVHRKGALSASLNERGVIPGSMGTASFHVVGRGNEVSLCSSSHGAGRALSRHKAAKSINLRQFQRAMHGIWFDQRQLTILREEAPLAYKDIYAVMRAQRELTKIERQLRPLLSYKGT